MSRSTSEPGEAGDPRRRDPAWVLGEALRLAAVIWENEDRNVEHHPGYDVDDTVNAAVELAGAVKALDGLLQSGYPLPHAWRKFRPSRGALARGVQSVRGRDWRPAVGRVQHHVRGIGDRLGPLPRPWRRKQG